MTGRRLVGDIGGTYARFAYVGADGRPAEATRFACGDYAGPAEAIRAFVQQDPATLEAAAIAVAAPVQGDQVTMTNHSWRWSIGGLRSELGLPRFEVVNDFKAIALALPRLEAGDLDQIGGGDPIPDVAMAVIGPGTGLGVSGLIPGEGGWAAISGEGGHVDATPATAREAAVIGRLGRGYEHVSSERLLSGPGLVDTYIALAEIDGQASGDRPTPAAIADRARAGEPLACEAAAMFSALLGAAAGNLALTLGALGGVFVAGGVVPGLGTAFDRDGFRRRFEAKGRFAAYLRPIPVYLVVGPNPALIGLAALLDAVSSPGRPEGS